jgi:glycosyltransferase involved in cell wall biosynthesis
VSEPTVSALVRVYNGERHVAETLEAILAQTRPADEVLVVDDGSTDQTPAVLAGFSDRIRVIHQPNGGLADAFERGFLEARGEFIANCDADDLWVPDKLERQLEALRRHPEIDIAFGAAEVFGTRAGAFNSAYPGDGLLEPEGLRRELYRADRICVSSALIRRQMLERVGGFRRAASPCEDYDFWLRSLAAGAVFFQERATLVRYRVHDDQLSDNLLKMHEQEAEVHRHNAALTGDRGLVRRVEAQDLSRRSETSPAPGRRGPPSSPPSAAGRARAAWSGRRCCRPPGGRGGRSRAGWSPASGRSSRPRRKPARAVARTPCRARRRRRRPRRARSCATPPRTGCAGR